MDKKKINSQIDAMADDAKQTVDMFSDKLDKATECAARKSEQVKKTVSEQVEKTGGLVADGLDRAADKIREKTTTR